jgi:hypothetical protein
MRAERVIEQMEHRVDVRIQQPVCFLIENSKLRLGNFYNSRPVQEESKPYLHKMLFI